MAPVSGGQGWGRVDGASGGGSRRDDTRRWRGPLNGLGADQDGDDGSGAQVERSMSHRFQDGLDRSRVAG